MNQAQPETQDATVLDVELKWVGDTLKKMREQLGMSQQELAGNTGVTTAYVYQLEKMPRPIFPSREYLRQFIELFMSSGLKDGLTKHEVVNNLLKTLEDINYQYYAKKYERKVAEKYSNLLDNK